jgi:putative MATE family efflux protein
MTARPAANTRPRPGLELSPARLDHNILELALPAVAENLLVSMVFFADTFLIGWLRNPYALAAVGLSGVLMQVIQALFQAMSFSATSLVAQLCGAQEEERAARVAAQAVSLGLIFSILVIIPLWIFAPTFFRLMGAEAETLRLGTLYIRLLLLTSWSGYTLSVLTGIMRGSGDTRTPMYITGIMNVWNVIAAATLIFGLGPFPSLGVAGAGIATASARLLGGLLGMAVLMRARTRLRIRPGDLLRWDGRIVRTLVRLSLPTAGEAAVRQTGSLLFTRIVSALGTVALAGHQIALNVESLSFMPGAGLSVAGTTLVGQSLGAGQVDLAEKSVQRVLRFAMILMGIVGIIFALFGVAIARLFGSTPEVVLAAGAAVRIGALEQIPIAVQMTLGGCLRGAGDMKSPMYTTFLGVLLFRVPVVYLFAIVFHWGLNGVWLATAIDWTGRMAILYWLYRRGRWKKIRLA